MTLQVNPDDFIITRKRKKYKFAKFANSSICYELDEWVNKPIDVLEVGAGTGLFSLELAKSNPDRLYLALDVKADRLQKGAYEAMGEGLGNIYFIRARADQVDEICDPESLSEVWVTFPDPFPRKRSAARRLTHPVFLRKYSRILKNDGSLLLKHDDKDFFMWSLESLVQEGWVIEELSFDLHGSSLKDSYKFTTTYEDRWLREGLMTNFVKARPPVSARTSSLKSL